MRAALHACFGKFTRIEQVSDLRERETGIAHDKQPASVVIVFAQLPARDDYACAALGEFGTSRTVAENAEFADSGVIERRNILNHERGRRFSGQFSADVQRDLA